MRLIVKIAQNAASVPPKFRPARGGKVRHQAVVGYGGLRLAGLNVVEVDAKCPYFGAVAPYLATKAAEKLASPSCMQQGEETSGDIMRVAAINTIPVVSEKQMRFLLSSLDVASIELLTTRSKPDVRSTRSVSGVVGTEVRGEHDEKSVNRSSGLVRKKRDLRFADLAEEYVSGSLIAADAAAACHSYDSEAQRVLVNADIDYRTHHASIHLLQRRPKSLFGGRKLCRATLLDDYHQQTNTATSTARSNMIEEKEVEAVGDDSSCAAAVVAMLVGLWTDEGSAIGLRPIRRSVYGPLVAKFAAHCSSLLLDFPNLPPVSEEVHFCDSLHALARCCLMSSSEESSDPLADALHCVLEAVLPLTPRPAMQEEEELRLEGDCSQRRRMPCAFSIGKQQYVLVRSSESDAWPIEACGVTSLQEGAKSLPATGLVCVMKGMG